MATFVADCPHCGVQRSSMVTFGIKIAEEHRRISHSASGSRWHYAIAASCSSCDEPVVAVVEPLTNHPSHAHAAQLEGKFNGNLRDIKAYAVDLVNMWPKSAEPAIPAHIGPDIERALLQAERNFPTVGNEEAAAVMYRRALELALKEKGPGLKGTLAERIKKMVASHAQPGDC